MYCKVCGANVTDGSKFCEKCGASLAEDFVPVSKAVPSEPPVVAPVGDPVVAPVGAPVGTPVIKTSAVSGAPSPTPEPSPFFKRADEFEEGSGASSSEPVVAPVTAPVPEPVVAPVTAPVPEPVAAPVTAPVPEPVAAPVAAPAPEPVAAPVAAPAPEPVAAPVAAPVPESVAAPVAAPAPEPVAAPVPNADGYNDTASITRPMGAYAEGEYTNPRPTYNPAGESYPKYTHKKKKGKGKVVVILLIIAILLGAGGFAAYNFGLFDALIGKTQTSAEPQEQDEENKSEKAGDKDKEKEDKDSSKKGESPKPEKKAAGDVKAPEDCENVVKVFIGDVEDLEFESAMDSLDENIFKDVKFGSKDEFTDSIVDSIAETKGISDKDKLKKVVEEAVDVYIDALEFEYKISSEKEANQEYIYSVTYNELNSYKTVKERVNTALEEAGDDLDKAVDVIKDGEKPDSSEKTIQITVLKKDDEWVVSSGKNEIKDIVNLFVEEN